VRPNARENGQIRPSNAIRDAWNAGAGRFSNLGFRKIHKMAIMQRQIGGHPVVIRAILASPPHQHVGTESIAPLAMRPTRAWFSQAPGTERLGKTSLA
jgi:hypothetical protein